MHKRSKTQFNPQYLQQVFKLRLLCMILPGNKESPSPRACTSWKPKSHSWHPPFLSLIVQFNEKLCFSLSLNSPPYTDFPSMTI